MVLDNVEWGAGIKIYDSIFFSCAYITFLAVCFSDVHTLLKHFCFPYFSVWVKILFLAVSMCVYAHIYVGHVHMKAGTCRGPGESDPLELASQAIVSYSMWVFGTEPSPFGAIRVLNCWALSPALYECLKDVCIKFFFKKIFQCWKPSLGPNFMHYIILEL